MKSVLWVSAVCGVIAAAIFLRVDDWRRDFTTNVASTDGSSSLEPLRLNGSVEETVQRLKEYVADRPHWKWVEQAETVDGVVIDLVRRTWLFRFEDDVQVKVARDAAGTSIVVDAISRSRVGRGDLGQNPRNIKELFAWLQDSRD